MQTATPETLTTTMADIFPIKILSHSPSIVIGTAIFGFVFALLIYRRYKNNAKQKARGNDNSNNNKNKNTNTQDNNNNKKADKNNNTNGHQQVKKKAEKVSQ